jgi:hypothetical protein
MEEAEVVAAREGEGGRVVGNATTIGLIENIAVFFFILRDGERRKGHETSLLSRQTRNTASDLLARQRFRSRKQIKP